MLRCHFLSFGSHRRSKFDISILPSLDCWFPAVIMQPQTVLQPGNDNLLVWDEWAKEMMVAESASQYRYAATFDGPRERSRTKCGAP